ncbi:MAG: UbiA family prenyltransferase [Chloroflexi bacterium]|nr:UbiA family prenyltransferase [Chloroflexota bacterium]
MAGAAEARASAATVRGRVAVFLEAIKFEHSVFALPFAVLTAFLLAQGLPQWRPFLWVLVAMVSARTFAMAANRLIDAEIDARNPRTAGRALPAGLLRKRDVALYIVVAAGVFGLAVSQLDPLAWFLSPVVIFVTAGYPYLKRFTWLSHLGLGMVYLIVPPATAIAITGALPAWPILMGFAGMFWVAGFDLIYATADVQVDRAQRLGSIPARFGIPAALWVSRAFHLLTVAFLVAAGAVYGAGILYYAGVAAAAILLAYEQSLVSPRDLSKLNAAFFTMNGVIAVVFATIVCVETLVA